MTPVTMYVSQIHLGKDLGAFGRHQESLQSLLEKMQVMSTWVYIYIVQCPHLALRY